MVMPGDALARRSWAVHPRGGETLSAWRVQRSMAEGSSSPGSRTHTVRLAYWKVSTAVAGVPQPGWAQRRVRNIWATYPGRIGAARTPESTVAPG